MPTITLRSQVSAAGVWYLTLPVTGGQTKETVFDHAVVSGIISLNSHHYFRRP
jgi:hypothetical protein